MSIHTTESKHYILMTSDAIFCRNSKNLKKVLQHSLALICRNFSNFTNENKQLGPPNVSFAVCRAKYWCLEFLITSKNSVVDKYFENIYSSVQFVILHNRGSWSRCLSDTQINWITIFLGIKINRLMLKHNYHRYHKTLI